MIGFFWIPEEKTTGVSWNAGVSLWLALANCINICTLLSLEHTHQNKRLSQIRYDIQDQNIFQ